MQNISNLIIKLNSKAIRNARLQTNCPEIYKDISELAKEVNIVESELSTVEDYSI